MQNYLVLKFEDVLKEPRKNALKISKFIGINYKKNMTHPKNGAICLNINLHH